MTKFIKTIKTDQEARDKMLTGMNILANAVGSTLGPRSRNVAVDRAPGNDIPPSVLHDGVSVARSINLKDVHEDMGVRLLKDASLKTNEIAGDGTTTSMIIAQGLVNEAFKMIAAGENPMKIKQEIEIAGRKVLKELKALAKPVKTEAETVNIASISAADKQIGTLVASAIKKIGNDGVITVEEGKGYETTVEYKQGMEIDRGYATTSPYFVTDNNTVEAVIENPYILITDRKINYVRELAPFLDKFLKQTKSKNIVIIGGEIVGEALQFLVVNKLRGHLNTVAFQAPAFGDRRIEELEDIAILTGGSAILEDAGRQIESVEVSELGRADKVVVDRDKSVIIGGKGDKESLKKRVFDLKGQITTANTAYDEQIKQERLAKLSGGVAVIHVGGATEVEVKEKKERVIDAKNATKAALEEGIVAGGEITLLSLTKAAFWAEVSGPGAFILKKAMALPFRKLVENSGYDYGDMREKMAGKEYPYGIDVIDGEVKDMIKHGIIDPVLVTRSALENAISVGIMAITTNSLITHLVEDK